MKYVLNDIEGTTTDINFVHKVLFPYSRERMNQFIKDHANDPSVAEQVEAVKEELNNPGADLDECIHKLVEWIDSDVKNASLKNLQGMIWKEGYRQGDFVSHVYDDVPKKWGIWKSEGVSIGIYSSGSVAAQKLLFSHTKMGDLTPQISDYYDLKLGPKKESDSYKLIAEELEMAPSMILFLSDNAEELDAAQKAGLLTAQVLRDGIHPAPGHHQVGSYLELS